MGEVLDVLLKSTPGVLAALGVLWHSVVKQRAANRRSDARIDVENQEDNQRITHQERDHVIAHFEAMMESQVKSYDREKEERKIAHDNDVKRLEAMIGAMGRKMDRNERKLEECERKHVMKDNIIVRLVERLKANRLLTPDEEKEIFRDTEDDSDAGHE